MLEKLIFKIGDREIELTKSEAEQLQAELNGLFGFPQIHVPFVNPTYDQWWTTTPVDGTIITSESGDTIYIQN